MFANISFSIVIFSCFFGISQCLNILVIYESVAPSHFNLYYNLFVTLTKKGHNVTVISHFLHDNPPPNYRHINLLSKGSLPGLRVSDANRIRKPKFEMYSTAHLVAEIAEKSCTALLTHPDVFSFLKEGNNYDVVLVQTFHSNCHYGITKKFKAPTIGKIND